jgi:predicted dehydrogenase/threonine dehydrogenase-like Zn-dependent dehydrogenase
VRQVVVDKGGSVRLIEAPEPVVGPGDVAIATRFSLISAGTESAIRAGAGGAVSLAKKAVRDPAVRAKAINRIRSHGLRQTLDQVATRASRPIVVGYSAAGVISAVGQRVTDLTVGQRVAAAGSGFANHAETMVVPRALVSHIPSTVADTAAAYVTLGAIALHAHRLSDVDLGASVAVIGLGVVGQLSCQLAAAAGCAVYGADLSAGRCAKARELLPDDAFVPDAEALEPLILDRTGGMGVDAVLIAAGSTDARLANRCIQLLRDRGRLTVIGSTRLSLDRDLLYRKEVQVVVSRSYGPGRYDDEYELRGTDYPIGYVRWAEGRNFAAVLELVARGRIDTDALTTSIVPLEDAARAYALAASSADQLGVLLSYGVDAARKHSPLRATPRPEPGAVPIRGSVPRSRAVSVALVGPGSFASSVLVPALGASKEVIVSAVVGRQPAIAQALAARLHTRAVGTMEDVLSRDDIDALFIATRHDLHADQAEQALRAGKHVFLEKPMGLSLAECDRLVAASREAGCVLMVDFNRRFSPHATVMRQALRQLSGSRTAVYRVDASGIARDHWLRDPVAGGGQVLGEAVHFIDLLCWLFEDDPVEVIADPRSVADPFNEAVATLVFQGGSSATLTYTTHGGGAGPKERLEVFAGGHTFLLDDYRRTQRDGKTLLRGRQRKGHTEAVANFIAAVQGRADAGVTALDGLRATRIALQIQGRIAADDSGATEP